MTTTPTTLRAADLGPEACYKLLSGLVVPRPIAWISTHDTQGLVNLAPFSCYTFVCSKPPMIGVNIGLRDGELKDTARNIRDSKSFVVNIGDESMLPAIHQSADEYHASQSETEVLGLHVVRADLVDAPRLREVPASMECRLHSIHEFGDTRAQFIVGEVVQWHFREGVCVNGKVELSRLAPIGRIGGLQYCKLGELVTMPPIRRAVQKVS